MEYGLKLGVVIPTINRTDLLIGALNSLETRCQMKLFIINNAVHNLSVAASWNRGVQAAMAWGAERILLVNDDVLFLPSTVDRLVERAVAGQYEYLFPIELRGLGYSADQIDQYLLPGPCQELETVQDHSCVLLHPRLYQEIGPYDEGCPKAYWEDLDYLVRIRLAGKRYALTPYAAFFHYGSASVPSEGNPTENLERGRVYIREKYRHVAGAAEALRAIGRDPESLASLGANPILQPFMRRA